MTIQLDKVKEIEGGWGYIFRTEEGYPVLSSNKKTEDLWKIGLSLCSGCKVGCRYCFTNRMGFNRNLSADEIKSQFDYIIQLDDLQKYSEVKVEMKEMGDPALNPHNLRQGIENIGREYNDLLYVVSTAGIKDTALFGELKQVKERVRLQFSCHTTNNSQKMLLSPNLKMMTLEDIAEETHEFYDGKERITLTFVPFEGYEIDYRRIKDLFVPDEIFVKVSYIDENSFVRKHGFRPESKEKIDQFVRGLEKYNIMYAYRNH